MGLGDGWEGGGGGLTGEVVSEAESVNGFSEAVEVVVFGQGGAEFEELVFKHEGPSFGGEEGIPIVLPCDGEPEARLVGPRYLQRMISDGKGCVRGRRHQDFGQEEPRLVLRVHVARLDLKVDAVRRLELDQQRQILNIVPVDVARLSCETQIRREAAGCVLDIRRLVPGTHMLRVDSVGVLDIGKNIHPEISRRRNRKDGRRTRCHPFYR